MDTYKSFLNILGKLLYNKHKNNCPWVDIGKFNCKFFYDESDYVFPNVEPGFVLGLSPKVRDIPSKGTTYFYWENQCPDEDENVMTIRDWLKEHNILTKYKLELEKYLFTLTSE